MKKLLKNEIDMLGLINKIQEQLVGLEKKVDILLASKPIVHTAPLPAKPNDSHKEREKFKAICADCQKECTIPFKPSGDRPVYCQDCFSRRKVIRLSGMKGVSSPQTPIIKEITVPNPPEKTKKKAVSVKKPAGKKKTVPKKK